MASAALKYSEIAREVNVSVATVSRAITKPKTVNYETRKKIFNYIEGQGHNLDEYLLQKNKKKEKFIILNLPNLSNPFYEEIVKGVRNSAEIHGYKTILNIDIIDDKTVEDLISTGKAINASGLILCDSVNKENLDKIKAVFQVVQCCEYTEDTDVSYVSIDDNKATHAVMDYIYKLGRRKIAILSGPKRYKYSAERERAYCEFLKEKNLKERKEFIINVPEIGYEMAMIACKELLKYDDRPDAIFAVSDVMAAAAIKVIREKGLSVPEDIAVVGFDNVSISNMMVPAITTVNQPMYQMGLQACEVLIQEIDNPVMEKKEILFDTEIIVRAST